MKSRLVIFSKTTISLVVTALLATYLSFLLDEQSLSILWKRISIQTLLIVIFAALVGIFLRSLRAHLLLRETSPGIWPMTVCYAIRNAFVDSLPARLGEGTLFWSLKQYSVSYEQTTSLWSITIIYDLLALAIVFIGVFLFSTLGIFWMFVGIILSLAVFSLFPRRGKPLFLMIQRWVKKSKKSLFTDFISRYLEFFLKEIPENSESWKILTLSLLSRLEKYGSMLFLFFLLLPKTSIGFVLENFLFLFCSFVFAELSASLPIAGFMGFGAFEGSWLLMVKVLDLPISDQEIAGIIFLLHLITQVVGVSFGVLGLGFLGLRKGSGSK
jgi:uncharacterized membrane protein YbhN (UPF0104 family)